ncbi:MAG: anti-sigma factor family protein, partial [Pyrinomonadaceae bacterium]
MNCEQYEVLLEEHLDGELETATVGRLEAHLFACAGCAGILAELQSEREMYLRYEREVEVTPAMWGGLAARIRTEERASDGGFLSLGRIGTWLAALVSAPRFSFAMTAALVVLSIGSTVVLMKYLGRNNGVPSKETIAQGTNSSQGEGGGGTINNPTNLTPTPQQTEQPEGTPTPAASNDALQSRQPQLAGDGRNDIESKG